MEEHTDHFAGKNLFFTVEDVKYEDLAEMETSDGKEGDIETTGKLNCFHHNKPTGKLVRVNGHQIALIKYKGIVYAMDEKCPHLGGPLHLGDIENVGEAGVPCVRCPWHSWKIALKTGQVMRPAKKNAKLNVYPVTVDDQGNLSIGFQSMAPDFFNGAFDF